MTKLKYNIKDKLPLKELLIYAVQQLLSVFVATTLIAQVCGTPVDSCLLGSCIGTLLYQVLTNFDSPMFISSSGATCSAVIGALATGGYLAVALGGFTIFLIYVLFGKLSQIKGNAFINKLFPPALVGSVTIVIGANLSGYIPTYVGKGDVSLLVALSVALVIAMVSHYSTKFLKSIPFLIGLLFGYLVCTILTLCFGIKLIDFEVFNNLQLFQLPDLSICHLDGNITWDLILQVVILFVPVSICAMLEHISDHKVLSNIIGTDLTLEPGLHNTLVGDGLASFIGTLVCGLPNTSYGESIATTGFSKVASTRVITTAAIMLGVLSFIEPIQIAVQSIPPCVFGGCAIVLYGYIMMSGIRTLRLVDLENVKNIMIICCVLTIGISGVSLFTSSFFGTSLAMVVGVILNILLKDKQ